MSKEKTFLLFGTGNHNDLRQVAIGVIERLYAKKGKVARVYDERRDLMPDALVYVSRHMCIENGWMITTTKGKLIRTFVHELSTK